VAPFWGLLGCWVDGGWRFYKWGFMSNMFEFLPVRADKNAGVFENNAFLPCIFSLAQRYKRFLFDDYYCADNIGFMLELIALINRLYPHFYVVVEAESHEFMGVVYLDDWKGNKNQLHSCSITTCFEPKFRGKPVIKAGEIFLQKVFEVHKLKKIKAEVFEGNFRAKALLKKLGFVQEGLLKAETIREGKPCKTAIFGREWNSRSEDFGGE
jgi:RimJ/RimL family protein N-acetyltransferase